MELIISGSWAVVVKVVKILLGKSKFKLMLLSQVITQVKALTFFTVQIQYSITKAQADLSQGNSSLSFKNINIGLTPEIFFP